MDETQEKVTYLLKHYKFPLLIGCSGLLFLGYGLIAYRYSQKSNNDITFTAASEKQTERQDVKSGNDSREIIVDISGGVLRAGVYHLPENSRVQDAITAAGGLDKSADTDRIAKNINLAGKLIDGTKIYIPKIGENASAAAQSGSGESSINQQDGLININTASEHQLDSLPGIGESTSQKIIDNRPYTTSEDLLAKKVVSKSIFEKIKEKITVY